MTFDPPLAIEAPNASGLAPGAAAYFLSFDHDAGDFVIVASAVVMLVQGNLALAFGLAAMVAAVRFRVSLSDALEGIYVFAAIAVGLACGIGFAGVAYVMVFFFCFANVYMWRTGFGYNEAEVARRKAQELRRERANQEGAN